MTLYVPELHKILGEIQDFGTISYVSIWNFCFYSLYLYLWLFNV